MVSQPERQEEIFHRFWEFFAYLEKYTEEAKHLGENPSDPGRTRLLAMLIERMRPVLGADISFVAYREISEKPLEWLIVDRGAVRPQPAENRHSGFIGYFNNIAWKLPASEMEQIIPEGSPKIVMDKSRMPSSLKDVATTLAATRVTLMGREYFLFFCDTDEHLSNVPRYDEFHRKMLQVATGVLQIGFQSGVRTGRQAQRNLEELENEQFLSELVHGLKIPIQGIVADASNLEAELAAEQSVLRSMSSHILRSAQLLNSIVDRLCTVIAGEDLVDELPERVNVKDVLDRAIDVVIGEAKERGIEIAGPYCTAQEPFPTLSLSPRQMESAFEAMLHNAIVYSVPDGDRYSPVEIQGYSRGANEYAISITNHGLEITPDEIENGRLFELRYRTKKARAWLPDGTGVGLASANRIIQKHGGMIEISSKPLTPLVYHNTFVVLLSTLP